MKGFLQRFGVRLFLPFFVIFVLTAWVLAVPYNSIDSWARRDHFRDIRDLMTKSSWLDLWRCWKSGSLD